MNSKLGKVSLREARRADVALQIELCTLRLCVERGVGVVTVSAVAAEAGVSRRTFYRYFKSINDVLTAQSKRSIERMSKAVKERPISENLREAFVNATRSLTLSDDELRIHGLGVKAYQMSPEVWISAMAESQIAAATAYAEMIAWRQEKRGLDTSRAPMIAAVLLAIIGSAVDLTPGGFSRKPSQLDKAIRSLPDLFET